MERTYDLATGRPHDKVAQSWWDAGFRVEGYPPPPHRNFNDYIRQLRGLRVIRRSRRRPWGSRFRAY